MKILGAPITEGLNDIYTFPRGGSISKAVFQFLSTMCNNYDIDYHVFVKNYHLLSDIPSNLYIKKTKNQLNLYYKASRFIKKLRPNILTQLFFTYNTSFNLLSEIKEYPFIIGMAELQHIRFTDEKPLLHKIIKTNPLSSYLFEKTLDYCDKIVTVNNRTKEEYKHHISNRKIEVIPYGVDLNRIHCTNPPNNHNILVIGNMIKRKGFDYMIQAMPSILKEYPDTMLNIIGRGKRENILVQLTKRLGITSNVIFRHYHIPYSEIIERYKECSIFCHSSLGEGFCHTTLEAMATGRPVISTDTNGSEMVKDNKTGIIVPANNHTDISNAILKLFSDKELAFKMGIEARSEVERNYDWNKITEKYYNLYREVVV